MIRLQNLTVEQITMLDTMWKIPSAEEFMTWRNSLDAESRIMCDSLSILLVLECSETDNPFPDTELARTYLKRFMINNEN